MTVLSVEIKTMSPFLIEDERIISMLNSVDVMKL